MNVLVIGKVKIPDTKLAKDNYSVVYINYEDIGRIDQFVESEPLLVFYLTDKNSTDIGSIINIIKARDPEPYVILLTKKPDFGEAVNAIKSGFDDVWVLPVDEDKFVKTARWVEERFFKHLELDYEVPLKKPIITVNPVMLKLKQMARQVAQSDVAVFIRGESGTGKELFARYIHQNSRRANKPFVAINCAAIPENLLESELFGFERGAFTGATRQKPGKFELADGGTLLLDEITEIPVHLQAKLLRVIQEGEVDRIGGKRPIKVNVRIIATSNANVEKLVQEGKFRKDLFFRLNVIPIKIPPLRERKEDIVHIATHLLKKYCRVHQVDEKVLSQGAIQKLQKHNWPGNVRELENVIQRALVLSTGTEIPPSAIYFDFIEDINSELELMPIKEMEKRLIFKALEASNGNKTRAAEILGITVRTLRNKLKEYRAKTLRQ